MNIEMKAIDELIYEERIKQVELFNIWAESEGFDTRMSGETDHGDKETHCAFLGWMAAQAKLEGCVVVPVEPTDEMLEKGYRSINHGMTNMQNAERIYKAMVEAARGGNEH